MKIAIATTQFPSLSQTFVLNHIISLKKLGHEVNIFAFRRQTAGAIHEDVYAHDLLSDAKYFDVPKRRLKRCVKAISLLGKYHIRLIGKLMRCCRPFRLSLYDVLNRMFLLAPFMDKTYDIIHCHFGPVGQDLIFLKEAFPKTKFLVTFHGFDLRLAEKGRMDMYRELLSRADAVLTVSDNNIEQLSVLPGYLPQRVVKQFNGIDLEKFQHRKSKENLKPVIVTVARLVPEKDLFCALNIIRTLKESGVAFQYRIVGDGDLRTNLEAKVSALGLEEQVHFTGGLAEEGVIKELQGADIFLLTSRREAFGVALLEAQAMGVPVVVRNVDGVQEAFQNGKTGFLFSEDDLSGAVHYLQTLCENPELRKVMGERGEKFVRQYFHMDVLSRRLESFYCDRLTGA
ncbi:MAG: glycosyltransferase [Candidatus Omnitrophica bacterium]|nr:glycosyltransferase [Candidatus Omnitrophota bacterium]